MRILHVSDLHYALPQFDWVVSAAPEFDLVVLSGDQLNIASGVPLRAQIEVVLEYLTVLHTTSRVVVSSGNHDLVGEDEHGEKAALWLAEARERGIPTDGDSVLIDDTLITVCPWWDGPVGREQVERQLAEDGARRPGRWLWVYHWPPVGSTTSWTGNRHYGDEDLRGWIEQHRPDLVLAGHVHQPPFTPDGSWIDQMGDTWILNPGNQIGPRPAFIELDLHQDWAGWTSLTGREERHLTS